MNQVLLKFPDALRPAFPRIKEKLDDPDPGVQCAAVNVICELARKNPKVSPAINGSRLSYFMNIKKGDCGSSE